MAKPVNQENEDAVDAAETDGSEESNEGGASIGTDPIGSPQEHGSRSATDSPVQSSGGGTQEKSLSGDVSSDGEDSAEGDSDSPDSVDEQESEAETQTPPEAKGIIGDILGAVGGAVKDVAEAIVEEVVEDIVEAVVPDKLSDFGGTRRGI